MYCNGVEYPMQAANTLDLAVIARARCPMGALTKELYCMPTLLRCCTTIATTNTHRSTDAQWQLLRQATQLDARGKLMGSELVATSKARQVLREAVQEVAGTANPAVGWDPAAAQLIISVLASDVRLGFRAMRDYCQGMGVAVPDTLQSKVAGVGAASIRGSVYLKYNVIAKQCTVDTYQGRDRGVLLQLGQEQVGHLPLGLFDDTMSKSPPTLPPS